MTNQNSYLNCNLSGQVALVTGATRGIGAAIALELAQLGGVVVGTSTTETGATQISNALSKFDRCRGAMLDVNNPTACEALVADLVQEFGALHISVNNAGITRDNLTIRMKDGEWDEVLDTNLKAVFRMSRAVIRPMIKQRYGRIVNITSVVGTTGNQGQVNYAAAKAGLAGMTRALARELGSRHITVNCVAPGFIQTDMTARLTEDQQKLITVQIPLGHLGVPADVAHAVVFLASPQAGYVTGQELHVNGGMFMA
jgi:3-oxoacyl-[acyl-carrier protein] reductase